MNPSELNPGKVSWYVWRGLINEKTQQEVGMSIPGQTVSLRYLRASMQRQWKTGMEDSPVFFQELKKMGSTYNGDGRTFLLTQYDTPLWIRSHLEAHAKELTGYAN